MPLPDGRTIPEPVEVASLPFSWLVGLSAAASRAESTAAASGPVPPQVSAVGYYDAQGADGAPTELQIVARAAGSTIAVITARVHRATARSRFVFRNTRSVVLPLGQAAPGFVESRGVALAEGLWKGAAKQANVDQPTAAGGGVDAEGIPHPNLPLIAKLGRQRSGIEAGGGGGWAVEVHSWVNGGSHLQCIPCKPRGVENGQAGHTAGAEPAHTDKGGGANAVFVSSGSVSSDRSSPAGDAKSKHTVAPIFSELARKVRSGDELSFVPYALPSLTLGCQSGQGAHGEAKNGLGRPGGGGGVCYCGAGVPCRGGCLGDIRHAVWLADWIGAEALPPALAVIDASSCLHVFELDDGASTEELAGAGGDGPGSSGPPSAGSVDIFCADGWLGKRSSTRSSTSSLVSLLNSDRHLQLKGFVGDGKVPEPNSSPERMSRRARGEYGGASYREDESPVEKTVVLPLDAKYGLGLTLAFEGNRVRDWSRGVGDVGGRFQWGCVCVSW